MSLTDRIGSLLQRPNDDLVSKDDVPTWLKYAARGVGIIAGGLCLFFGVFNAITNVITLSPVHLLSSVLASLLAFSVLAFEAPFCCMFVDHVQDASNWMESRPYWNKAACYMIGAAFPNLLWFSISQFLGLMLIFCTGLLYGMMALGRKASSEEMRNNAVSQKQQIPPGNLC